MGKFLLIVLLVVAAAAGWLWWCVHTPYRDFGADGVFVTVPRGASSRSVARILRRDGVVRSAVAFEFYARRHPRRSLQAGEYFFDQSSSAKDVFWKLANGQVFEQPFTVREGETMFDIARELEAGKFMTAAEFLAAAKDPGLIKDLSPRAATLEGFLFPATYHLARHPTAIALTTDMVRKFKEEWSAVTSSSDGANSGTMPPTAETTTGLVTPAAPDANGDISTTTRTATTMPGAMSAASAMSNARPVVAIVTLASLVERETPKAEERPLVAGVFRESDAQVDAAAVRSHGDLCVGAAQCVSRNADDCGFAYRFAVQHLYAHGIASGADWKSGRGFVARGVSAGDDELFVFRGEYAGRAFLQRDAGGAQR